VEPGDDLRDGQDAARDHLGSRQAKVRGVLIRGLTQIFGGPDFVADFWNGDRGGFFVKRSSHHSRSRCLFTEWNEPTGAEPPLKNPRLFPKKKSALICVNLRIISVVSYYAPRYVYTLGGGAFASIAASISAALFQIARSSSPGLPISSSWGRNPDL